MRIDMKRNIEDDLLIWKNRQTHMPLLLRGARQVGKTYVVEQFGKQYFENVATANFEQRPELIRNCFGTLEPQKVKV